MEHLYVITGASRGLGAAIAAQLLGPGNTVLGVSRRTDDGLDARAAAAGAICEQWTADLAAPADVAKRLQAWLAAFDTQRFHRVALINNAAMLTRTGHVEDSEDADLVSALRVGLEAPVLLSAALLRATRGWRSIFRWRTPSTTGIRRTRSFSTTNRPTRATTAFCTNSTRRIRSPTTS